jgi:pimeloyl-ACP methyl ester carboxylesterase
MMTALKWTGIVLGGLVLLAVIGFLLIRRDPLPYSVLEQRYAHPTSRYMDMGNGVRVHYREEGRKDGPVLLLVHGFSDSTDTWNGWIARLGADYRIIALDLPGHGLTRAPADYQAGSVAYADLTAEVAHRLGVDHFIIAGNSMGGGVAWVMAERHPEKVKAAILVDAAGWPSKSQSEKTPLAFKLLRTGWGRWLLSQIDLKPVIAEGVKKAFYDPDHIDPALINRFADEARGEGHSQILMAMQTRPYYLATAEKMARIKAPVLVMHGQEDHVIPVEHGKEFGAAIPGASLILYPKVGHSPQLEIPDQSTSDLKAFLKAHNL